jgi:hypothetical protein
MYEIFFLVFPCLEMKLYVINRPLIQLGLGKCKFCASKTTFNFHISVVTATTDFSQIKIRNYVKII